MTRPPLLFSTYYLLKDRYLPFALWLLAFLPLMLAVHGNPIDLLWFSTLALAALGPDSITPLSRVAATAPIRGFGGRCPPSPRKVMPRALSPSDRVLGGEIVARKMRGCC